MPVRADFERLIRDVLPGVPPSLDPDTDLRAAGLDSMATVELLLRVEEAFGVDVPDSELTAATFATPGALWTVVERRMVGGTG
ncbi:phosphopantetheine-binding protein [Saccharothrix longispora]|uniref:phosphopantetheine-binding protein n=1 Tax=Saccharothrix longispora TaxID=33920 RepID=UPI0028FDBECE|nr:phosphopantetheine-binding protein [Saccharothrix longispora]MBY8848280.1 acyl carrier protein [Saccharothrix sp. MB29]MDU0289581.1 phosphopantetheine-binding protein [Saccharothrix longispora]